jgi:hypothetical protein
MGQKMNVDEMTILARSTGYMDHPVMEATEI